MSPMTKRKRKRRHLTPGQKLVTVVVLVVLFAVSSTVILNLRTAEEEPAPDGSGWEDSVEAYVIAAEGETTAPFYNEGFAVAQQCARGVQVELESWEPYTTEGDGAQYYHAYLDGQYGYFLCENITDDRVDILQENRVYVRSPVNLLRAPGEPEIGSLVEKGTLLRLMGYDYFREDGTVNMYQVKLGNELGWIKSDYVAFNFADAMENWSNDANSYSLHVRRGDNYGGGDASTLDYFPHEKGDFADQGNVMPEQVYALYIPSYETSPAEIQQYLDMAEGTAINAFVITICDDGNMAYYSPFLESQGLMAPYTYEASMEEFARSVQMLKDAGYYTIARITSFKDEALAKAKPEWSIADNYGSLLYLNDSYWPSPFCRDVWQLRVGLAVEAVDEFGFNEVQFDYVRFPDWIKNYLDQGSIDLRNTLDESMAQAVQRFLTYACDVLHAHGAYVGADVFGEVANDYVAPYGQYWPAISTVVDVISGMPYPDHFTSYYSNELKGYYNYYEHPYQTLYDWGQHVVQRQSECSSPAVVRTWLQTWDVGRYKYDSIAVEKQIVALYDAGVPQGYMCWHGQGTLFVKDDLHDAICIDYYAEYEKAQAEDKSLSEYLGIDTENT